MSASVDDFGVYPVRGESGRYHVKSSGKRPLLYLVDLDELTQGWCSCQHFEFRISTQLSPDVQCKHIVSARSYQRLQRRFITPSRRML